MLNLAHFLLTIVDGLVLCATLRQRRRHVDERQQAAPESAEHATDMALFNSWRR